MTIKNFSYDYSGKPEGSFPPYEFLRNSGTWNYDGLGYALQSGVGNLAIAANLQNNTIEIKIGQTGATATATYAQIYFRKQDSGNYWEFRWRPSNGVAALKKFVGGSVSTIKEQTTQYTDVADVVAMKIVTNGDDITVYLNDVEFATVNDADFNTATGAELNLSQPAYRMLNASFAYDSDIAQLPPYYIGLPQKHQGLARSATRLGKMFDNHGANNSPRSYWQRCYHTSDYPNWNSTANPDNSVKYPVILEDSSDHALGGSVGGFMLRVYEEKGYYDLAHKDSWHEWQDISSRPEFDHIIKKTGIIYTDPEDTQAETPTRVMKDGVCYMFYHVTDNVQAVTGRINQTTKYATSTNGVDFTYQGVADFDYDAEFIEGNSHDGYQVMGVNNIDEIPYTYISTGLHGGGDDEDGSSYAINGSDDLITWHEIATVGKYKGYLYNSLLSDNRYVTFRHIHNLRKEGAYYRAVMMNTRPAPGGIATGATLVEILMDGNLNLVSQANTFLEPVEGEFDALQVADAPEISYYGRTWAFYPTRTTLDDSAITEIGALLIEDVPYEWNIERPLSNREELITIKTNGAAISTGLTFNQTTSFKTEDKYDLTSIKVPANGDAATILSDQSFNLVEHEYIDVLFDKLGKDSANDVELLVGIVDNLDNPIYQANFKWYAPSEDSTTRSRPMYLQTLPDGGERTTPNYFGNSDSWEDWGPNGDESPRSKHNIGLRVIPFLRAVMAMEGISETVSLSLGSFGEFDFYQDFKVFIKARLVTPQAADDSVSIGGIRVIGYKADPIAIPDTPVLTTAKTDSTITFNNSVVAGSTGYKNFIDDQEVGSDTAINLFPDTDYRVYSRAVGALGDSSPNAITTVRTSTAATDPNAAVEITRDGNLFTAETQGVSSPNYSWRIVSNSGGFAALSATNTRTVTLTTQPSEVAYTVRLGCTVNGENEVFYLVTVDSLNAPTAIIKAVNENPLAEVFNASGADSSASAGSLTYSWTLSKPVGSSAELSSLTGVSTSYSRDVAGTYTLNLTVTDVNGSTGSAFLNTAFELENTKPTTPTLSGSTSVLINTEQDVTAAATDDGGAVVYEFTVTPNSIAYIQDGDTITISTGAYIGNIGISARAFDGSLYSDAANFTMSVSSNAQTSIGRVNILDVADGLQPIKIISEATDLKIYEGSPQFTNGVAFINLPVAVGVAWFGRWLGTNPPQTGTGIFGVSE